MNSSTSAIDTPHVIEEFEETPLQFPFRSFLDAAEVGMWVSDRNGRIKFFNKSWLNYTGRTLEEELSHEWTGEEVHADDWDTCKQIYSENFNNVLSFDHEYRMLRYDGEYRWVHEYVKPYYEERDIHTGYVGTCIDITEHKQIILLADELVEKSKDLEQFAYIASHDLQEPLRKIESFGELIKSRFSDDVPEKAKDYINRMQKSASRMRLLINDLLTFSRVSSRGKSFVKIDLKKETEGIIHDLEIMLKETKGIVTVDNLGEIEADPSQIRQLLLNIIGNGIKYHRKDELPVVTISSCLENVPDVLRPKSKSIEMLELKICDNGIGFDEKYKDKIFEPFQRLHGRNEFEGTGIGLAICKKIVERHQGNIDVSSKEGLGSEFIIQLPIKQLEQEREHE